MTPIATVLVLLLPEGQRELREKIVEFLKTSERIVEDIFSVDKSLLAEVLSINAEELHPIARQKRFDNRRILDMLYLYRYELLLIELKAVPFYFDIIEQINDYHNELQKLQNQSRLVKTNINKIVLVTDATKEQETLCSEQSIRLVKFNVEELLSKYYANFRELSAFLNIQPANRGVSRLYLMKSTLLLLNQGKTISEICQIENKSKNTIYNRLIIACLLGILEKDKDTYVFTAFGRNFMLNDDSISSEQFSENQFAMLSDFVKENPFYSQITFSIMSVVDTIFILSKAEYPVKYDLFKEFFIRSLGKDKTWIEARSQHTGVYHFANYAKELGFIHQIDDNIFLTPCGIQAILIFQLNRSIQLIKART